MQMSRLVKIFHPRYRKFFIFLFIFFTHRKFSHLFTLYKTSIYITLISEQHCHLLHKKATWISEKGDLPSSGHLLHQCTVFGRNIRAKFWRFLALVLFTNRHTRKLKYTEKAQDHNVGHQQAARFDFSAVAVEAQTQVSAEDRG